MDFEKRLIEKKEIVKLQISEKLKIGTDTWIYYPEDVQSHLYDLYLYFEYLSQKRVEETKKRLRTKYNIRIEECTPEEVF
jgi:hypothetical protein